MKDVLVLFSLLLLSVTWGLSVQLVTYSIHTVQIDNNNNFEAAIFSFTFDQEIKFVNNTDPTKTLHDQNQFEAENTSLYFDICFPPLSCVTPPYISSNVYRLLTLSCPSETVYSVPQYGTGDVDGLSPPSYLMIFGGSLKDPLLNFFAQAGILEASYKTAIDPHMLHAVVLLSYTEKGVPFLLGEKIRTIGSELSNCVFKFGNGSHYYLSSQDLAGQPFYANVSGIKPGASPACKYFDSLAISTSIVNLITSMSNASNWNELQQLQFENALLESSDAIVACKSLISTYMTYSTETVTFPNTTDCLRDLNDPLYDTDPCCNTTLQFYQCCAAREKNISTQVLKSADTTHISCHNTDQSSALLIDYVVNSNAAADPITGCRATAATVANDAILDKYTNFIDECLFLIYGSKLPRWEARTCSNDSDCFTHCNAYSECSVEWNNPDEAMLDCHMQMIDPQVVTLLKIEWELPFNTTEEKFREIYYQKMSSENCVGYDARFFTWERDAKGDLRWVTNNKEACIEDMYCNYNYALNETECNIKDEICIYNETGIGFALYFPEYCYLTAYSAEDCQDLGGEWDGTFLPFACMLPNTSRDECIPDNLCPPHEGGNQFWEGQCEGPFCYDPTRTTDNCTLQCGTFPLYNWTTYTADGHGFCEILVQSEDDCYNASGTWWNGRGYNHGYYNTKETCENSGNTCSLGELVSFGANCSLPGCTDFCHICESQIVQGYTLCYSTNMTDCDCVVNGGVYDTYYGLCSLPYYDRDDCESLNYTYASCQSLSKDQCDACYAGDESCPQYYDLLACKFAWFTPCQDEDKCLNVGGECNDPFFNFADDCDMGGAFNPEGCEGSCLHDLTPSPSGNWGCPTVGDFYTTIGCIALNVTTQEICESMPGYRWQNSFTNKQDCEAKKGCQLGATVNLQNQQECKECNGDYESLYQWAPAQYVPAKPMKLYYITANYTNLNTWKQTLDFQIIEDTINRVVAEKFALALETEAMCLYNPLLDVITHIACDCTGDTSAPPNCYLEGTRITSVGVQRFYAGISDSIKAGSVKLTMYANSIPVTTSYLDVDIDIASASQFRQEQTLSVNVLSSSFNTNPYAIVKNAHKAVVGQLVGDGVVLSFIPADFKRDATSAGDPNFELQNSMQVCMQLRSDISHSDKDFPVPDFATPSADYKTWTPIETSVTITADGYCFDLKQQGTYFPILRTSDWATRKNKPFVDNKAVLAFIYIFGIVFICLSFVSAYQIWIAAQSVNRRQKLNLALFLFTFMFLFNMVRGLYLLIFPSGRLEHSQGAKYFLSESPQFFFFSVYSVIIFLWAELSVMVTAHKTFLYHFKWPFILTNIGLYVLFIVVVSTYHTLTLSHQKQLQKAYVYILAFCCLVAIIAFNVIGRKLIKIQLRANRNKTNLKNSATLKRMVLTIIVSSITLIGQIIFLFIVTYSTVSPGLALMAYVLTEVLPSATLLFTLRPLSRKVTKPSASSSDAKHSHEMRSTPRPSNTTSSGSLPPSASQDALVK